MDNFTHSLAGWIIGQTGLKTKTRKGLAALILGANMPDIDVLFGGSCWLPLATHRGFTHSLTGGILIMPPLLAALLWLFDRWQVRRGTQFKSGLVMDGRWLVALSYVGALTHPLLDWQTSYAVQLFSPFSNAWLHAESLFIIDVWLWSGIAFAIWLSRRWEKGSAGELRDWRRPAQIGIAAAMLYIGVNHVIGWHARQALLASPPYPSPDAIFLRHEPVLFWRREIVWREDGQMGFARFVWPVRTIQLGPMVPDNMSDPPVRRARYATPELRRFMRWSVMPMARVIRERCSATVVFTDARYADPGGQPPPRRSMMRNPFDHRVVMPLAGPGCPDGKPK